MFLQDTVEQRRGSPRAGGRRKMEVNEETALRGEPRELGLGVSCRPQTGQRWKGRCNSGRVQS